MALEDDYRTKKVHSELNTLHIHVGRIVESVFPRMSHVRVKASRWHLGTVVHVLHL